MGTGNTIFTESGSRFQQVLKKFIADAIGIELKLSTRNKKVPFENVFKSLSGKGKQALVPFSKREMIPYLSDPQANVGNSTSAQGAIILKNEVKTLSGSEVSLDSEDIATKINDLNSVLEDEFVYEAPKIRANK